jgi:hypothetical protein
MKRSVFLAGMLTACLAIPVADAQKTTEQFIPVGQSPGLSGEHTLIGRIESADPVARSVTLAREEEKATITVTDNTRIWLDRSPLRLPNVRGTMADLVPGRLTEVKLTPPNRREAEWIKVQMGLP